MTCVAKWKEGNKRYFVALVNFTSEFSLSLWYFHLKISTFAEKARSLHFHW